MKRAFPLALIHLVVITAVQAQAPAATTSAANSVQLSQPDQSPSVTHAIRIPAGTRLEIEAAFNVSSLDVRPEDLISFRVVVPIKIDGATVIEKYSLVTGRIVEARRGRHWGRAGKLSWIMQDVVAVDLTRVPLQAQKDLPTGRDGINGTSHGGEVAAKMIVFGALLFPATPLVLMSGFKRGENAVLPEGRRFTVLVKSDTIVTVPAERPAQARP